MSQPHRPSTFPTSNQHSSSTTTTNTTTQTPTLTAAQQHRQRQYSHLNAQLAQLNAHLADMENLCRMTAIQAEYVRGLGGWMGGLFMASSKILGEETVAGSANTPSAAAAREWNTGTANGSSPDSGDVDAKKEGV